MKQNSRNNMSSASGIVFSGAFLLMLLLNYMTLKVVDDYRYCFSFVKGRPRIVSAGQIVPSMMAHYRSMNGRLITHGLTQFFLMAFPPVVFDIINAAMFCLLCFLIYDYTWKMNHSRKNAGAVLIILAAVWAFVPAFGQVFLWLDGSVNYLWPAAILLLYLRPVIKGTLREKNIGCHAVYALLGIIMGGLSETISLAAMGCLFLNFFYEKLYEKKTFSWWNLLPVVSMAPGYLFMILSPGTRKNKLSNDVGLAGRFIRVFDQFSDVLGVLFLVWVLLAVCVYCLHKVCGLFVKSCIFMFLSLGMNFMHASANSYPERGMTGVTVFLLIAIGMLVSLLWDSAYRNGMLLLCTGVLVYAFSLFVPGVYDVKQTYHAMKQNEIILQNAADNNEKEVSLQVVYPDTPYSAAYNLKYLDTDSSKSWPNNSIAQYYGLDKVNGIA